MENEKKVVSINDLKNNSEEPTVKPENTEMKSVPISEIREYANESGSDEPSFMDKIYSDLDVAIHNKAQDSADVKEQISNLEAEKKLDEEIEEVLDGEVVDEDPRYLSEEDKTAIIDEIDDYLNDEEEINKVMPIEVKAEEPKDARDIDEEDFDSLLDEDEIESDTGLSESDINSMKSQIKEKIVPYRNNVDFSKFTIAKKHIGINKIFNEQTSNLYVADWALPSTGRPISMSELTGTEIEKLNAGNMGRSRYNTIKDIYRIIYEHDVNPNKTPSLEVWAKSISFYDIDHLYFALYRASFEGSNHIPYHCPECNKVFLQEVTDINSMVKYKSEKAEEYVKSLLNKDIANTTDDYETTLVQVSDNIAVALRKPSIFNVTFENAVLDEKFTDKYNDLLALLVYIDSMYFINRETNELIEIETNPEINNLEKTVKRKVVRYTKVIRSLTSDQFYELNAKIKDLNDKNEYIDYVLPAAKCPHCGKSIDEEIKSPESLLFTRHQLAALANI